MALPNNYEEEILKIVRQLDDTKKQELLSLAKNMNNRPQTVSGKEFIEATKHIRISEEDADVMMKAVSEAFDVVDEIEVDFDE